MEVFLGVETILVGRRIILTSLTAEGFSQEALWEECAKCFEVSGYECWLVVCCLLCFLCCDEEIKMQSMLAFKPLLYTCVKLEESTIACSQPWLPESS